MDTARLFLGFVIGALLVFLLSYNYYFREENNEQLEQLTEENNTLIGEKNEIQKKYDELNEKYQGLNDTFEEVKKQVDYYLNASKLLQIEKYVSQNQYREAADLLLLLKNTAFTGVEKKSLTNYPRMSCLKLRRKNIIKEENCTTEKLPGSRGEI